MKRIAVFSVVAMALSTIASGDIIVTLNSGPLANLSNFNWTYTATLHGGSSINSGDFFTIYDIGGLAPGVPLANPVILPGSNWISSIQFVGTNGFNQSPADSTSLYNVTFTFTGSSPIVAVSDTILGGGAGAFGYTSVLSTSAVSAFSVTSHATGGGAAQGNTSSVVVAGVVPEPAAMFLSGSGLIALSFFLRRRRLSPRKGD
jgi:hypothetical protein